MSYQDKDLFPVRSESELRAGMTIVVRCCPDCSKSHTEILFGRSATSEYECNQCGREDGWKASGPACAEGTVDGWWCFCDVIPPGLLFRLDTREKTKERTRELERAR